MCSVVNRELITLTNISSAVQVERTGYKFTEFLEGSIGIFCTYQTNVTKHFNCGFNKPKGSKSENFIVLDFISTLKPSFPIFAISPHTCV